jgi:hypothetical protein
MASYTVVLDYTEYHEGDRVESVTIRQTDHEKYPCGYDYSLHYGTLDGETLLRYDNAHERTKGHERHAQDGAEIIEFPGMVELYDRFQAEIAGLD